MIEGTEFLFTMHHQAPTKAQQTVAATLIFALFLSAIAFGVYAWRKD